MSKDKYVKFNKIDKYETLVEQIKVFLKFIFTRDIDL